MIRSPMGALQITLIRCTSTIRPATMSSTAASEVSGMYSSAQEKKRTKSATKMAWKRPASGDRAPAARQVAVRATQPPTGKPPQTAVAMFPRPRAVNSWLGWLGTPRERLAICAASRDSVLERKAMATA